MVNEAVKAAMDEKEEAEKKAKKAEMVEKLKANSVELSDSDIEAMSVNALQVLLTNSEKPKPAYGLAGAQSLQANADEDFEDTLPE